jgi:hypothetical protein
MDEFSALLAEVGGPGEQEQGLLNTEPDAAPVHTPTKPYGDKFVVTPRATGFYLVAGDLLKEKPSSSTDTPSDREVWVGKKGLRIPEEYCKGQNLIVTDKGEDGLEFDVVNNSLKTMLGAHASS